MSRKLLVLVIFAFVAAATEVRTECIFPDELQLTSWRVHKFGTSVFSRNELVTVFMGRRFITTCLAEDDGIFLLQNQFSKFCWRYELKSENVIDMQMLRKFDELSFSKDWAAKCRSVTKPLNEDTFERA